MTLSSSQIVALNAQGLSAEEISAGLGCPVESVRLALATSKQTEGAEITEEERRLILQSLKDTALRENENISAKVKAAIYLNEEANGRNEARAKGIGRGDMKVTIQVLNQYIASASKRVERILDASVPAEPKAKHCAAISNV